MNGNSPNLRPAPLGPADKRLNQLLTWSEKDPAQALAKGWYREPGFCDGFFDRCEHQALIDAPQALDLARCAVHFATLNGDPHLINRAHGVLAHAYIARSDLFYAGKTLAEHRARMLGCCPLCSSDYFRREADFYLEQRQPMDSLRSLVLSFAEAEDVGGFDPDRHGRVRFLSSIVWYQVGMSERAIRDSGTALQELAPTAPRGLFLDTVALISRYVRGGDEEVDAYALEQLECFRERIQGAGGWCAERTRLKWVLGHLYARCGDVRRARRHLESACTRLLAEGLEREAVAVTLDLAQLYCHPAIQAVPREPNLRATSTLLNRCLRERADLTADHRRGLEAVLRVLDRCPESVFRALVELRQSVTAPVANSLAERIGKRKRTAPRRAAVSQPVTAPCHSSSQLAEEQPVEVELQETAVDSGEERLELAEGKPAVDDEAVQTSPAVAHLHIVRPGPRHRLAAPRPRCLRGRQLRTFAASHVPARSHQPHHRPPPWSQTSAARPRPPPKAHLPRARRPPPSVTAVTVVSSFARSRLGGGGGLEV